MKLPKQFDVHCALLPTFSKPFLKSSALFVAVGALLATSPVHAAELTLEGTLYGTDGLYNASGKGANGESKTVSNLFDAMLTALGATSYTDGLTLTQNAVGGNGGGGSAGGGNGGDGFSSLFDFNDNTTSTVTLNVGAMGGDGGSTASGNGGDGGGSEASANNISISGGGSVVAKTMGGNGGSSASGSGGTGGYAVSSVNASTNSSFGGDYFQVTAKATGGKGGNASGAGIDAGFGGVSEATAIGEAQGATLNVTASQTGGDGGDGSNGANGGAGAASSMDNFISGTTTGELQLTQTVRGGNGGSSDSGRGGNGGEAITSMAFDNDTATYLTETVNAYGGDGGNSTNGTPGDAGSASAFLEIYNDYDDAATYISGYVKAIGGTGGTSTNEGNGRDGSSIADVFIESSLYNTKVLSLDANAIAYGGGYDPMNPETAGTGLASATTDGPWTTGASLFSMAQSYGAPGEDGFAAATSSAFLANNQTMAGKVIAAGTYAYVPTRNGYSAAIASIGTSELPFASSLNAGTAASVFLPELFTTTNLGTAASSEGFTVLGTGAMGVLSNGEASYTMGMNYTFDFGTGNDLFLYIVDWSGEGEGIENATLTVMLDSNTDDSTDKMYTWFFDSIEDVLAFVSSPVDLGTVDGSTTVDINLVELTSGLGGNAFTYELAIVESGTVTGTYRNASTVPLPGSFLLFATGLLALAGYRQVRHKEML